MDAYFPMENVHEVNKSEIILCTLMQKIHDNPVRPIKHANDAQSVRNSTLPQDMYTGQYTDFIYLPCPYVFESMCV